MRAKQNLAHVVVDGRPYKLGRKERLVFGRGGDREEDVVGLDAGDMGISAVAGSVHYEGGRWVVANRSEKRPLLVEAPSHTGQVRVGCQRTYALCDQSVVVLVPGLRYTHRIEVRVPESDVQATLATARPGGNTVVVRELCSDEDIEALTAVFSGYLRTFPRRNSHPLTYKEAAALLGKDPDEDAGKLRKRIENFRARLARRGIADISGEKALYELAEFLLDQGVIGPDDLERLP